MAAFHLRRFLTIATAAAAIAMSGCGKDSDGIARVAAIGPDPKLVETVTAPLTPGEALIRASMAQGLVRFDERGQVVPGLAERWNVSDDGLSYIFRIATGEQLHRTFHVGEQHGHLFALAFERAFGGENFLGKVLGGIGNGRCETRLNVWLSHRCLPALQTELSAGRELRATLCTCVNKTSSAL